MDLARENYANGGDLFADLWDEKVFDDNVRNFGIITMERAMHMFRSWMLTVEEALSC